MNVTAGWLLAIVVALLLDAALTTEEYGSWGWRVAFAPAVVLAGLSFLLRLRLPESPVYAQLRASGGVSRRPFADLFRTRARSWLICTLMVGVVSAGRSLTVSYLVVFVASPTSSPRPRRWRSEASACS